jgi:hypothetical protein
MMTPKNDRNGNPYFDHGTCEFTGYVRIAVLRRLRGI